MNRKTILILACATLIIASCGNKYTEELKKREQESAVLFEKEYAEFTNSEQYKSFGERYKMLLALTEEISGVDSLPIPDHLKPDSLCFEPEREWEMEYEQEEKDNADGIFKVKPFKDYVNLSAEVNAIIINEEFFKSEESQNTFGYESDIHRAFTTQNKNQFMDKCALEMDTSKAYAYERFCKLRILMDKVNNAKYAVILKKGLFMKWKYLTEGVATDFFPGIYSGTLYIYNIPEKKMQYAVDIIAMNSETITGTEGTMETAFKLDLEFNVEKAFKQSLDTIVGLKGDMPHFEMNFGDITEY